MTFKHKSLGTCLCILMSIFMLSSCGSDKISEDTSTQSGSIELVPEKTEKEIKKEEAQAKIKRIKKKLALKGLIVEGEIHLENEEFTIALSKFLQIKKELPDDPSITQKIAETFFALKRFDTAYRNYLEIKDYDKIDTHQALLSLLASRPIHEDDLGYFVEQIASFPLSEQEAFYYLNAIACTKDFSQCKKRFEDFFEEQNPPPNLPPNKGEEQDRELPSTLLSMQQALENYTNFQIDDLSYKDALVIASFYEHEMYPIAVILSEALLEDRPGYAPILKILAKSYFELGDLSGAKKYLIEYNKDHPNENDISFALGVVYQQLKEYVLSSIHLKKALDLGHEPKEDIYRRLIYNANETGDSKRVLFYFQELIEGGYDNTHWKDYSLAIYHHIAEDDLETANAMTQQAQEKFPENELFDGYRAWILMEQENPDFENAQIYVDAGLEKNKKSAMLHLIAGRLKVLSGDSKGALIYFKKTIALDEYGEFGDQARNELESLQK
ncbi:hypothetical protein MK079_04365 [Candidatus Gracilibacteria bacterium]|nr:hypothetical protein [Candidatus Gracilibacteria bacterium]